MGQGMDAIGAIVFGPALLASFDLQQVFETARDQQPGSLAAAREKSIEDGGRAVAEHLHFGEALGVGDAAPIERRFDRGEEAAGNVLGSGGGLADAEVSSLIDEEG